MPFAQIKDITMYYEVRGDTGTPLLLVMGLGASHLSWEPEAVARFAARHRVILFDNRGVGQTDIPTTPPYTMPQFAADAVGLLDALGIDRAHVFGVSMGGMIAQHIALDFPERVRGLALGCTTPGGRHVERSAPDVLEILVKPPSGDRAADLRGNWRMWHTPEVIQTRREALEEALARELAYPEQPRFAFELQMGAIVKTHHTFDRLPGISAPTLVQVGLEDRLIPPGNSHMLAEQIPNARLIEYPAASHSYLFDSDFKAADDILDFLAEVEAAN